MTVRVPVFERDGGMVTVVSPSQSPGGSAAWTRDVTNSTTAVKAELMRILTNIVSGGETSAEREEVDFG